MTDVVWVFPTAELLAGGFEFTQGLGASYVAGYLAEAGIQSEFFLPDRPMCIQEIVEGILEHRPRIVGFTCWEANIYACRLVSARLKAADPSVSIVFGGSSATHRDQLLMERVVEIDVIVRGEGELTAAELYPRLMNGDPYGDVPGITFRSAKSIVRNPDRPNEKDVDRFPSPYASGILPATHAQSAGLITARGCPYRCTYCAFPSVHGYVPRAHSIERIASEISILADHRESLSADLPVLFCDDTLAIQKPRLLAVCEMLRGLNSGLRFYAQVRADRLDSETIQEMARAGFYILNLGMESIHSSTLRRVKKCSGRAAGDGQTIAPFVESCRKMVEDCLANDIQPIPSIICGLPGETNLETLDTIEFVDQLPVPIYSQNSLTIFPGTELASQAESFGYSVRDDFYTSTKRPFRTIRPHNICELPWSKRTISAQVHLETGRRIAAMMSGETVASSDRAVSFVQLTTLPDDNTIRWLRQHTAFDTTAVYLTDKVFPEAEWVALNASLVEQDVPLYDLYQIVDSPSLDAAHAELEGIDWKSAYSMYFIPATRIQMTLAEMARSGWHSRVFRQEKRLTPNYLINLRLDDKESKEVAERVSWSFQARRLPENVISCSDTGCQWADVPCPALSMDSVGIEAGEIKPCRLAPSIGTTEDSPSELIRRVRHRHREVRQARGCDTCPVESTCSQCLYPTNAGETGFCEQRIKYGPVLKKALGALAAKC